ncbi:MAG: hypothetical protein U0842_27785 [Candidatus Binatia bacterium]
MKSRTARDVAALVDGVGDAFAAVDPSTFSGPTPACSSMHAARGGVGDPSAKNRALRTMNDRQKTTSQPTTREG